MIKHLTLAIILGAGSTAALAGPAHTTASYGKNSGVEEAAGVLGGMAVGTAIGGPPGTILGGLIGGLIGDGYAARKRSLDLQSNLYESQLQLAALREEAETVKREYRLATQRAGRQSEDGVRLLPTATAGALATAGPACCSGASTTIHFKSGSSDIQAHYRDQLESLASLSRLMPEARIEITGYADRRGDAGYNLALSRERSQAVKDFFAAMGIQNSSIKTIAYGESRPLQAEQSIENDFFDRRVLIRLTAPGSQMLSSSTLPEKPLE